MDNKTVFIFGAGASKADNLPVQAELFEKYFKRNPNTAHASCLRDYFRNFFNIENVDRSSISEDKINWPTFEEALAMVEIAMDKEQSFGHNYNSNELKNIRNSLIISMGNAIENCSEPQDTFHNKFIKKLFKGKHYCEDEYSFVSFNYDILLDKALINLFDKEIYCDYGFHFENASPKFKSEVFHKWVLPGEKKVLILKPHGSFNWVQCPSCDSIYISGSSGDSKSRAFSTGILDTIEKCPKDNTELQFVIEPPSYFKKFKNYYLQTVWKRFHEVLTNATKLVFIGYSMPDADIMIKYVIKRACLNNKKTINVVNLNEFVKERYQRFFGKINYFNISFSDLLKSDNYKKIIINN